MTSNTENIITDISASYLDIAEFIQISGAEPTTDLQQLWRRIIFNIAVSNTDDHLLLISINQSRKQIYP